MDSRDIDSKMKEEAERRDIQEEEDSEAVGIGSLPFGGRRKKLTLEEIILYALIILSVIGVGITQSSVLVGRTYWLAMIPIIAAATLYVEWMRGRHEGIRWRNVLRTQLYHWGTLLVSVELVHFLYYFGRLNNEAVSLVILVLIAHSTFLIGIYVDWRFSVVALFQALCVVILAYLKAYIWMVLLIAGAIIGLGFYFHRKFPEKLPSLSR